MTPDLFSDIQIRGIVWGKCASRATITNRPFHALIYKESGKTMYRMPGKTICLPQGSVLYIPKGESYSFENISEGDGTYCLVNFTAAASSMEKSKIFSPQNTERIAHIFKQMQRYWLYPTREENRYALLALFYHLLFCLTQSENKAYHPSTQLTRLKPATDYLENHIYSPALRVSTLSALCGISDVAFRNLFFSQFEETPKKHIIRCRMMKAKAILESGEYDNIGEVAGMVGYEDALYFSRLFKGFFGVPPSGRKYEG